MKKFILIMMFAAALLVNTASAARSTVTEDVTDEEVLMYLYAPAASAEEQALKDRLIWERLADNMFEIE